MAALTVYPQVAYLGSRGRGGVVVAAMCMGAQNINTKTPSSSDQILLTLSRRRKRCRVKVEAFWSSNIERPSSVKMEAISGEEELDQLLDKAHQSSQLVIIEWMAKWCRKCIYLKPKLEKLAAEFHPKVKFYYVDVNDVSQALVQRGGISFSGSSPMAGCICAVLDISWVSLDVPAGSSVYATEVPSNGMRSAQELPQDRFKSC